MRSAHSHAAVILVAVGVTLVLTGMHRPAPSATDPTGEAGHSTPGCPPASAEKAGLRGPQVVISRRGGFTYRTVDRSKADLVTAVDGKPVHTLDDLLGYVESKKPGDSVTLSVLREGKVMEVKVQLEEAQN